MANILITVNELLFSRKFIAGAAAAAAAAILLLVPLLPVTIAQEEKVTQTQSQPYQVIENHTESYQEPQTQQVPVVDSQQKSVYLGGYSGPALKAGAFRYWSGYVPPGATIEYAFSLGAPVNFYIVPSSVFSQYPPISKIQHSALLTREGLYFERGTFKATQGDTYYFVIYNPTSSDIPSLYASSAASWVAQVQHTTQVQTMVTKTKQVYGPVTMYRDVSVQVTQTKQVSGRGTLLDVLRSNDPVGTLSNSFQSIFGGLIGGGQNNGKSPQGQAPTAGSQSSQDKLQAYNRLLQNYSDSGSPPAGSSNPAAGAANTADKLSNSVQQLARNPGAGIDTCGAC